MTIPLAIAWTITALTLIAHLANQLPETKAYGLYALGLAAATIHCLWYGSFMWGLLCAALTALCAAMWAVGSRTAPQAASSPSEAGKDEA